MRAIPLLLCMLAKNVLGCTCSSTYEGFVAFSPSAEGSPTRIYKDRRAALSERRAIDAELPANNRGLVWIGPDPTERVSVWMIEGVPTAIGVPDAEALVLEFEALANRQWLVRPRGGFVPGSTYEVMSTVSLRAEPRIQHLLIAVSQHSLASDTLEVQLTASTRETEMLATGASCSSWREVSVIDLELVFPPHLQPFAELLLFETTVDGIPFSEAHSLCSWHIPGRSWYGPARDRVYRTCGGQARGIPGGVHSVEVAASLPGTEVVLSTGPRDFQLSCEQDAVQRQGHTIADLIEPELVTIPSGRFRMGRLSLNDDNTTAEPVRTVTFAEPFMVGKHEVTFAEYDVFARLTGRDLPQDHGWGRGRRPVINVIWHDAVAYARWLSEATGKPYRLLTEAEWEYVARAGTETQFHWGDPVGSENANCRFCSRRVYGRTAVVGSFPPNQFGVYDMHGNAAEFTQDCYVASYEGAPDDGSARVADGGCRGHVARGGSWQSSPANTMAEARGYANDGETLRSYVGFRLARDLPN